MSKDQSTWGPRHSREPLDRKTFLVAEALGLEPMHAYGFISAFRARILDTAPDGVLVGGPWMVENLACWSREPGKLAEAFRAAGVVDVIDGKWVAHEHDLYGGASIKARAEKVSRFKGSSGARQKKNEERAHQEAATADGYSRRLQPPATAAAVALNHLTSDQDHSDSGSQRGSAEGEADGPEQSLEARAWFSSRRGFELERDFPTLKGDRIANEVQRIWLDEGWDSLPDVTRLRERLLAIVDREAGPTTHIAGGKPVSRGPRMGPGVVGAEMQRRAPTDVNGLLAYTQNGVTLGERWTKEFPALDGKAGRPTLHQAVEEGPWVHWRSMDQPWVWPALAIGKFSSWLRDTHAKAKRDKTADEGAKARGIDVVAKPADKAVRSAAYEDHKRFRDERDHPDGKLTLDEYVARYREHYEQGRPSRWTEYQRSLAKANDYEETILDDDPGRLARPGLELVHSATERTRTPKSLAARIKIPTPPDDDPPRSAFGEGSTQPWMC